MAKSVGKTDIDVVKKKTNQGASKFTKFTTKVRKGKKPYKGQG